MMDFGWTVEFGDMTKFGSFSSMVHNDDHIPEIFWCQYGVEKEFNCNRLHF